MNNILSTQKLIDIRKSLDFVRDVISAQINEDSNLISFSSTSSKEQAQYDALKNPESFYNFRIGLKAVSVIRNCMYFYKGTYTRTTTPYYHVKFYNTVPSSIFLNLSSFSKPIEYDIATRIYGSFESFDECISLFYYGVLDLIRSERESWFAPTQTYFDFTSSKEALF